MHFEWKTCNFFLIYFLKVSDTLQARTWRVVRCKKKKRKWKRNRLSEAIEQFENDFSFICSYKFEFHFSFQFSVFDWILETFLTLRISCTFIIHHIWDMSNNKTINVILSLRFRWEKRKTTCWSLANRYTEMKVLRATMHVFIRIQEKVSLNLTIININIIKNIRCKWMDFGLLCAFGFSRPVWHLSFFILYFFFSNDSFFVFTIRHPFGIQKCFFFLEFSTTHAIWAGIMSHFHYSCIQL